MLIDYSAQTIGRMMQNIHPFKNCKHSNNSSNLNACKRPHACYLPSTTTFTEHCCGFFPVPLNAKEEWAWKQRPNSFSGAVFENG